MKAIAFDFDGVIADTAGEAFIVFTTVWAKNFDKMREAVKEKFGVIISKDFARENFYEIRKNIITYEDVWILSLQKAMEREGRHISKTIITAQLGDFVSKMTKEFLKTRNENLERNISAIAIYPGIKEVLQRLASNDIYIITRKDPMVVRKVLQKNNMPFSFKIISTNGKAKDSLINDLSKRYELVIVIDDMESELRKLMNNRAVLAVQATWGYGARGSDFCVVNSPEELIKVVEYAKRKKG